MIIIKLVAVCFPTTVVFQCKTELCIYYVLSYCYLKTDTFSVSH